MALPALVVLALVALVSVAARGSTPGGSDATRPPSETLYDTFFSIGLLAVIGGGLLLLYGLSQRRAIQQEVATGKYRRTSLLAYLAFVGVFTAFTSWRMTEWDFGQEPPAEGDLVRPGNGVLPALPDEAEASYEPRISWIPIAVVVALCLAAVVGYVVAERRARRGRGSGSALLAEQLAAVFDDTLDDLRAETDPRRAIIAAYARLERVLAANGVPRRDAETSDEYLARVLGDLELSPDAIRLLTSLYTRARFSHHEIDTAMKEDAIGALETVRDELRAGAQPVNEPSAPAAVRVAP